MRPSILPFAAALAAAFVLSPAAALADQFVETFDGGSNTGGWTYGAPTEVIESNGGNPGAYLHASGLDTYAPQPRTTQPSIFSGDFRAAGVTSIGVDLATFYVDFSAEGRPLSLMLYSDNGTPGDDLDDWAAYTMGENIPIPGEGWRSYDFDVPSDSPTLPAGWLTIGFGPGSPENPDWNDVITNVSTLGFFYGDPTMVFIFQMWELGMDNVRITYGQPTAVEATTWGGVKALFR
ncbi:MAG: hypothetical protein QUU85_09740 [Candidatus Eisenbacteria bacterium]|nr:hypothetical protein [Candidatus Eisenbacteria bacterium]